jgi:Fe-S-cluster-containing hydrogenase component 2
MAYVVDVAKCTNCSSCDSECPVEAISEKGDKRWIEAEKCVDCGACSAVCPVQAITGV